MKKVLFGLLVILSGYINAMHAPMSLTAQEQIRNAQLMTDSGLDKMVEYGTQISERICENADFSSSLEQYMVYTKKAYKFMDSLQNGISGVSDIAIIAMICRDIRSSLACCAKLLQPKESEIRQRATQDLLSDIIKLGLLPTVGGLSSEVCKLVK